MHCNSITQPGVSRAFASNFPQIGHRTSSSCTGGLGFGGFISTTFIHRSPSRVVDRIGCRDRRGTVRDDRVRQRRSVRGCRLRPGTHRKNCRQSAAGKNVCNSRIGLPVMSWQLWPSICAVYRHDVIAIDISGSDAREYLCNKFALARHGVAAYLLRRLLLPTEYLARDRSTR